MDRVPRFSSLFYKQRLNAAVLPMLGGIALFLLLPQIWATLLILIFSAASLLMIFRKEEEERKIFLCVLAGLSLALMLMGASGIQRARVEKLCHKAYEAEGFVVAKEEDTCDFALYRLDGDAFYKRVRVKDAGDWKLGQRRCVKLVLYEPDPENARSEGISALATCVDEGAVTGKSLLYTVVGQVREGLSSRFAREKNGGFLSAVLLGDQSGLTEEQKEAFRRTASSHILAISGLHVSMTVSFVAVMMQLFPIPQKFGRIILFPLVFVLYLLAGAGVSVFRACVMTLFAVSGLLLRRRTDSVTSLCFSAAILVVANPYATESFSFLLSYVTTFGVVWCGAPLCEYVRYRFTRKDMPFVLRKLQAVVLLLVMSSVSFVFITPIQLLLFETASPYAPLYAVILIPVFQICLLLTLIGALLSGVFFLPEAISSFCLGISARFPDFVIFLAKGSAMPVESGSASRMIASIFLIGMLVMYRKKAPMTSIFLLQGIWIVFLGGFSFFSALFA